MILLYILDKMEGKLHVVNILLLGEEIVQYNLVKLVKRLSIKMAGVFWVRGSNRGEMI